MMNPPITVIMVPKGAEYTAVAKGVQRSRRAGITLVPLPVGPEPVRQCLQVWCAQHSQTSGTPAPKVVIMGLCGSLRWSTTDRSLRIGDAVLYERIILDQMGAGPPVSNAAQPNSMGAEKAQDVAAEEKVASIQCDRPLTSSLGQILGNSVMPVTGVMCDRVIHRARDKQILAKHYGADVVEMEGYTALSILQDHGIAATILRVVSDDALHDLPDLSAAFREDGTLRAGILAQQFLRQPVGAYRLIRGSLIGLKVLTHLTVQLLGESQAS